jgi:hypothetical protein
VLSLSTVGSASCGVPSCPQFVLCHHPSATHSPTTRPTMAAKEFAGQVAVVTGGARGIGFAIGKYLGQQGAAVVLVDIQEDVLSAAVDALQALGIKAFPMVADVTSEESIKKGVGGTWVVVGASGGRFCGWWGSLLPRGSAMLRRVAVPERGNNTVVYSTVVAKEEDW